MKRHLSFTILAAAGWISAAAPLQADNSALMAASFAPFKPKVRYYSDSTYFYEESDGIPSRTLMPNLMVGITSWQQQVPLPTSYFSNTINPADSGSAGYLQPNYWRIPLVPVPAASPISLSNNFQRGAVALAADGIAIFNPRNNTGQFSHAIGELDAYGGHCGLGDDYHYHIYPTHLTAVLGNAKPIAWALDGYPIYGYVEPDGTAMQALDSDGGHTHGTWGYHYHARGTYNAATNSWTPTSPYMMNAMHGTVVNYGGQIDPQPSASGLRGNNTGGYTASPVAGATITAFKNPVALTTDGSGNLVENVGGTSSDDNYLMRYTVSGTSYDLCWKLNRGASPKTLAMTWRLPTISPTTLTYNSTGDRITAYPMAASSIIKLPDTGQTLNATTTPGEDSDYTLNAPSFTDNGNSTITDNVTGLMWQKTDNGESTWENAVTNAATVTAGGYTDWRLPTPLEAMSILNHDNNPALNSTYFLNNASGTPGYWWTSDLFGSSTINVWCTNSGGGLGPKPKSETISAGGTLRYHARYVRAAKANNGHNYVNNSNGTITDTDTNLMWAQAPSAAKSWNDALLYAEGLTLGGSSDWRLPNVKELQSLVDITRASATATTTLPCINRTLFPTATATAYWSSTSVKASTPSEAWLVEFGVNASATPSRNAQGIVSYDPYASTHPAFAVRSIASSSITQGRATTTTTNLLAAGQRVSGVGSITAADGTVWTVPAVTQFTTANKAGDLYNDVTSVTPANIAAAATAISNVPTVVVDADGEVITGYIFADNYFELYVNGVLIAVDPVPYTPFNSCVVKFKAKRPITYAIKLVDWEENLGLGTELNGTNAYHPGDGGLMASFSDGTVTNSNWKAQAFNIAPLDNPALVTDLANGTHDSSAVSTTHTLTETAYALHYPVPSTWFAKTFSDSGWPAATTYTEATVGVDNKPAYTNFPAQFSTSGAQFIWSSNLVLDNEVIVRYTGPAAVAQISVEQPTSTILTDATSTVAYGSVATGATLIKSFTIRNNGITALTISGTTIDGPNLADFTITTPSATSIAAGGSTTMNVQFAPTSAGAKIAALHIASSDSSVGTAFDINLTGTGTTTPPTISLITTSPTAPTNLDSPWVNAKISASSGNIISSAQLSYNGGASATTNTVFTETMAATASAAMAGWTGTGAINPWTVTNTGGAGNVKQTTAANHGTGNACGLDMNGGSATATGTMVSTTNAINAVGTSGYVEFWMATSNLTAGLGWTFQLSTDGSTWNTRLSEITGSNHDYLTVYHYDLLASERVSTLKMRFQFIGNGSAGPTSPSVRLDDIKVVTTSGSAAVTLAMFDDGAHNDGLAGDGVYGVQIPAQTTGSVVSYTIAATDNQAMTTTSSAGSYTVGTATPVLAVTPATGLSAIGSTGGTFAPSSATYTLSNTGTGTLSWTASKTAGWITLSSSAGSLAAGASTTVSATINSAANSLGAANFSDVLTFTNSSNASGNTTRAVALTVTAGAPTAPAAPVLPTLAAATAGSSITLSWTAVSGATSYTLEISSSSNFSTGLLTSQTVTSPTATFASLTGGTTYYYRVLATNSVGSSGYSNMVFSTQNTSAPTIAITSPASGSSTTAATSTVQGTSSGATSVKVNNVVATSSNSFATWTASIPLGFGTNSITATATNAVGTSTTSSPVLVTLTVAQTYNPLIVPDTISGTTFNLTLAQKTKQLRAGATTATYGYNNALLWGPTLIMNKGDYVQMNVTNNLADTTTVHWHGFHIPAIMDGGPHQTIPAGTTWSPSWVVKNDASTYWYHPHLHGTTMEQLVKGAGGFIIVKDPAEAALALPRTYGVDDFPLALTSRRILTSNQFSFDHGLDNYGDYMMVNGTLAPQVSLPKQYVRLRILNAEVARAYNLGFSDNRTYWIIGNDQGLLSAPVAVTRMKLAVGERVEILVNLTNDTLASSIDLKAYNSGQVFGFPGQEGNPLTPTGNPGPLNGSLLNNTDFNVLHINVAAATANPITALPTTLVANTYWTNANVTNTRSITLSGGNGGTEFTFNNISYTPTLFNHTIPLNAIEKWSVSNNAGAIFGHSFHIHDIKFNIIARSGGTQVSSTGLAATYESGWKDTIYVPKGETVDVIAKYDDFASNTNPFMFHCHMLQHEDGGMMGQFVVVNNAIEDLAISSFTRTGANSDISLVFKSTVGTTYNLQYSPDLTTGSWIDIGSVTSDGSSANFTETNDVRLGQPKGFYRVTIPKIP